MGKNDVVEHKLVGGSGFDWNADVEPVAALGARPLKRKKDAVLVAEPNDTMIDGQVLDESPYRSVGKMMLKFAADQQAKGASGWVVAPKAFMTAGHCVFHHDFGGWISEAAFCPRFNLTCSKSFTVVTVYTLQGWIDANDDWQYDLAACVVSEAFTGKEPPLAFETNRLPAMQYAGVGYPIKPTAKHEFNGKRMWQSFGDCQSYENGVLTAVNDLTGGASGGPWLEASESDAAGGLTSARPPELSPNLALSPYFTQGITNLYDAVKNL